MSEETTGVCFFAYNNEQLDYIKLAHVAASYVKQNMKNNTTCLITDQGTQAWLEQSIDPKLTEKCFDYIVMEEPDHSSNPRKHYDSPWTEFSAQFSNSNKHKIFELSPFDKTLLLDTDYIIQNNFYDYIFDTDIPFALHKTARYLEHQPPYLNEQTLNEAGIHHWWSTVVYFDKSEESKTMFDTWSHVKDNWDYYHLLYQFPPALFRTDFCVSIAAHLLNGYNNDNFVHDFQGIPLINMDQKDDLIEVKDVNDWIMLSHNRLEPWRNILIRNEHTNVHAMNKRAVIRHSDRILELMKETVNE